ncbi:MAG: SMI1/KNR4 family protein [Gemmobacter sp.]
MLERKDWQPQPGVPADDLDKLTAAAALALPEDYLSFLRVSNGGEGPLSVHPLWLVLDPAALVVEALTEGWFAEFFPGFVVIGLNGAGEAVAFDTRSGSVQGLIHFDMTDIDLDESVQPLAPSFAALLDLLEDKAA